MRSLGPSSAATVLMLAGLLPALPSAHADPADVQPMRVTAPCRGGPGSISFTVDERAGGGHHVDISARRVADGSQWALDVFVEDDGGEHNEALDTVAEGGTWSVAVDTPVVSGDSVAFWVTAVRTDQSRRETSCFAGSSLARPTLAAGFCGRGFDLLRVRELTDGTTVVRYTLFAVRHQRWEVTVTASDGREDVRTVSVRDRMDRRGRLDVRLGLSALDAPVLAARATSSSGRSCWLKVDPGELVPTSDGESVVSRELLRRLRR